MRIHPSYNGDYLYQASCELTGFIKQLESNYKNKLDGIELPDTNKPIYSDFPRFDFPKFRFFSNDKLSSANNFVYVSELKEVYRLASQCIRLHSKLSNKPIVDIKQTIENYSTSITESESENRILYHTEMEFCYKLIEYCHNLNTIFKEDYKDIADIEDKTQEKDAIQSDRGFVFQALGETLSQANQNNKDKLINRILSLKYLEIEVPEDFPTIDFRISQTKMTKKLTIIKKELGFNSDQRKALANIFASIEQYRQADGSLYRYNGETMAQNMY